LKRPFSSIRRSWLEAQAQYAQWVEDLAVKHRERAAWWGLLKAGMAATPAVRRGLRHPDPKVRIGCCGILDHFMDEAALPELMANLTHEDADVRSWALHALACDRCKEGTCRPGELDVLPIAIRMLREDPSRAVRKQAAAMIGPAAHRSEEVRRALEEARDTDPDPLVRKVAGWQAPGGSIYRRLRPKPAQRGQRVPLAPG
jgi:HEAT repeat protein